MIAALTLVWVVAAAAEAVETEVLLTAMEDELSRSFRQLEHAEEEPLYFLQYAVSDDERVELGASYGAVNSESCTRRRHLTIDARVGSYALDNTHEIRGGDWWQPWEVELPVEDDGDAIEAVIWKETDRAFKEAQERFIKVRADRAVRVAEADTSPDFSPYPPQVFSGERAALGYDADGWRSSLRRLSERFREDPWIHGCGVRLSASATNAYLVNTEGTRIVEGTALCRVSIYANTIADDGMELYLYDGFDGRSMEDLPDEDEIAAAIDTLVAKLHRLRDAPVTEPYTGPAILVNKASGVFFHEIFGHRMEGHRQKSEEEGQTFTKKVGEKVLPDFMSVYDDPTVKEHDGVILRGHYRYDDEGVPAQRAALVDSGVLRGFLMSRSPIEGFPASNGHGRRQHGRRVVARQGNLIVESTESVPFDELRGMLVEECKKQEKPYGLVFYDIAGGFTGTRRWSPQVFKVIPLFVTRIYTDGREEVIRGVDIVGTPLMSFARIAATGDDSRVFNGTCGAESGAVPVSAISPSILVQEIEVEKKAKGHQKPPLLPAPLHD